MHNSDNPALRKYDEYIISALATQGGHLSSVVVALLSTMPVVRGSAGTIAIASR
jgi:hypothetical protein